MDRTLGWASAAITDVGTVRQLNEDACLDLPERQLWAVADGMGGHTAGDVASLAVVDAIQSSPPGTSLDEAIASVIDRLQAANRALYDQARRRKVDMIGSTVVALVGVDDQVACIWAGDSRAYRLRDGRLEQLSRDHSRVQELIESGQITEDQARGHPEANVVTRALGAIEEIEIDSASFGVESGDIYLLCSDGLGSDVTDDEVRDILARGNCKAAARQLIDKAIDQGARDNVTVVVIRAFDDTKTQINPDLDDATVIDDD